MNDLNVKKIGVTIIVLALILPAVGVLANVLAYGLQLVILKLVS